MGRQHAAGQVGIDDAVPVFQLIGFWPIADIRARIIHQNIQTAEPPGGFFHHAGDRSGIGHIHRDAFRLGAQRAQACHRCVILRGIAASHHHSRARLGQARCHAEADAAIATGHQRHAAGQIKHLAHALALSIMSTKR